MSDYKLGEVESRFADIVWQNAPLSTAELVKRCESALHWKRTTTYTVLKKLGEKGLFELKDGIVSVLVPRDEYYSALSEKYVDETFDGSLPAFLAAFTRHKTLSAEEIMEIRRMIDAAGKE